MVKEDYPPLADILPYRCPIGPGQLDLRDEGALQCYWLRGPSPDISDAADLLKKSEQLGKAPMHFCTGDSIQIVYDRWATEYSALWAGKLARLKYRVEEGGVDNQAKRKRHA